jgi:hypothetical protein
VADDGSIAPDPRRLARAHRAGLRPASPLLLPGVMCLALAAGLRWGGPQLLDAWRRLWANGLAGAAALDGLGGALGWLLGGLVGLVVVVASVNGGLGWVDRAVGRGLGVGAQRSTLRGGLMVLAPWSALLVLAGVCAGAARAVDASEAGLLALWWGWLMRLLVGVGGLLLLAGGLDLALARRRLWQALHRSAGDLRRGDA